MHELSSRIYAECDIKVPEVVKDKIDAVVLKYMIEREAYIHNDFWNNKRMKDENVSLKTLEILGIYKPSIDDKLMESVGIEKDV